VIECLCDGEFFGCLSDNIGTYYTDATFDYKIYGIVWLTAMLNTIMRNNLAI